MKQLKVLTICQGGNCRSVCLGFVLKYKYNIDAVAASWEKNTKRTLDMLCEWADKIIFVEAQFIKYVPKKYSKKFIVIELGPDRWGNSLHPELINICGQLLWVIETKQLQDRLAKS